MLALSAVDILYYINMARTNPRAFSNYIQDELDTFVDYMNLPLDQNCNQQTWEGKAAWVQCKQYLDNCNYLPPYTLSPALCLAAEDHAADLASHYGLEGHIGFDGSTMSTRIYRRGFQVKAYNQVISIGENIGGDFLIQGRDHALNVVRSLLVDDGVSSRGHRKNLLSPTFRYIGIGIRIVNDKIKVVMDFHTHDPIIKDSTPSSRVGTQFSYRKTVPIGGYICNVEDLRNSNSFVSVGKPNNDSFNNTRSSFGSQRNNSRLSSSDSFSNFGKDLRNTVSSVKSYESGKKVAVNTNKNVQTTTRNGKIITKTTIDITYNDGSTERKQTTVTK